MAETDAGTPNETSNPLEATPCLLGTLPVMLDALPSLLAHPSNVAGKLSKLACILVIIA
jgi:hypothetical protein